MSIPNWCVYKLYNSGNMLYLKTCSISVNLSTGICVQMLANTFFLLDVTIKSTPQSIYEISVGDYFDLSYYGLCLAYSSQNCISLSKQMVIPYSCHGFQKLIYDVDITYKISEVPSCKVIHQNVTYAF